MVLIGGGHVLVSENGREASLRQHAVLGRTKDGGEEPERGMVENDDDSSVAMDEFLQSRIIRACQSDDAFSSDRLSDPFDPETDLDKGAFKDLTPIDHETPPLTPLLDVVDNHQIIILCHDDVANDVNSMDGTADKCDNDEEEEEPMLETPKPSRESSETFPASSNGFLQHLTPTGTYNPFSNYAPGRATRRKEIMGMSLFLSVPSQIRQPLLLESEQALENYARQIRMELRHQEMLELAVAAERAADAGVERFSARPSTFAGDLEGGPLRPTLAIRQRSAPLLLPRRNPKVTVMSLRNVEEVLPSFANFHIHLRTHLVRKGVAQNMLLFREQPHSKKVAFPPIDLRQTAPQSPSTAVLKKSRLQFLKTLDLQEWVGNHADISPCSKRLYRDDVELSTGDVVSNHQAPITTPAKTMRIPPTLISHKPGYVRRRGTSQTTVDTVSSSSEEDSNKRRINPSDTRSRKTKTSSRALFDDNEEDDEMESGSVEGIFKNGKASLLSFPEPRTPVVDEQRSDFVTPARLRYMRAESTMEPGSANSPLLMPSNSVLESPREDLSPKRFNMKARTGCSPPRQDGASANDNNDAKTVLLPLHMIDDDDTSTLLPRHSRNFLNDLIPQDNTIIQLHAPIEQDVRSSRLRRLKVSVYATPSRLEEVTSEGENRVLQQSELMVLPDSANQFSPKDCGCPTNTSYDAIDEMIREAEKGENAFLRSTATALRESSAAWNRFDEPLRQKGNNSLANAFKMISRLSPGNNFFQNKPRAPLYFRSRENEEFLNNYLYCSKPAEEDNTTEPPTLCTPEEACHGQDQKPWADMILNPDLCCAAILGEVGSSEGAHRTTSTRSFVSVGGDAERGDAETWFDMATEKIDSVLEKWMGSNRVEGDTWRSRRIFFQAPSLKKTGLAKQERSLLRASSRDPGDDAEFDGPHLRAKLSRRRVRNVRSRRFLESAPDSASIRTSRTADDTSLTKQNQPEIIVLDDVSVDNDDDEVVMGIASASF